MNILLIGYGKMGRTLEKFAYERNHKITHRISSANRNVLSEISKNDVDVALEFSHPDVGYENIKTCIEKSLPVVSGTTGWLHKRMEIEELCIKNNGAFFYASNFSIGVNIFFQINNIFARLMNSYHSYDLKIEETHHIEKKDAPSGTALTLAEDLIENIDRKHRWKSGILPTEEELEIKSIRLGDSPGIHSVNFDSKDDSIKIKHTSHTRDGFAEGAIVAAEWIVGRCGVFGMNDMLKVF